MVDYILTNNLSSYSPSHDKIKLGLTYYKELTNNEIFEYICDTLEHEHIHRALFKLFDNRDISALFDTIAHKFGNNKLHKKIINLQNKNGCNYECYDNYIKRLGYDVFLELYHIDDDDLKIAIKITKDRRYGDLYRNVEI